jgi:lipopolysaccharide biosynthesis glycosyltransferase
MTSSVKHVGIKPTALGAYCLANDEALEWFQAFVRSFRRFNPDLPLTVIPYNASIARLKVIREEFQFSIMEEAAYTRFDAIAERVAGQRIAGGTFRKLSCFSGAYDTFIFLDSDIVVTSCFDGLFQSFQKASCDFVYFDTDMTMVYTPDFARKMIAEYHSPGFNSGAFIARRDAVSEDEIMAAVASGEKIRDQFSIWGEQPFLNYLFDVTRRRLVPANKLIPEITAKPWARTSFAYDSKQDRYMDADGRQMPFVHWAGCEWPTMVRPEIFLKYRTLGMGFSKRVGYCRKFYYRRFRAKLKEFLSNQRGFAKLLKKRDRWLEERRKRAEPTAT